MEKWIKVARKLGFEYVQSIYVSTLEFRSDIRSMCALNLCGKYGTCWTCPPICGDPDTCRRRLKEYSRGFLVETLIDCRNESIAELRELVERLHRDRFKVLCQWLYPEHPEALCLISGGCPACETCAWPESCPHPEKAASCLTGYGLLPSQILRENGIRRENENILGITGFVLLP